MYFSVIIPTYNPQKYLPSLLDSIEKNDCKDDIEVIIVDDVSKEDFSDILEKYNDNLNIVFKKNEEHCGAPIKGRQSGSEIATGKWMCFADQDDWFTDHAFDEVKKYIEDNNAKNYIVTDFYISDKEGYESLKKNAQNWTHGKFYEKKFWDNENINYENTKYCEDISLSVKINCILTETNSERFYFEYPTYIWYQHEDSLSNASKFNETGYFFKSFPDYIRITLGLYVDRYKKLNTNDEEIIFFYQYNIFSIMAHLFFYFQGIINADLKIPKKYYKITYDYFQEFLKIARYKNYKEWFNKVSKDIEFIEGYSQARNTCVLQIPFIETESFYKWISKLKWRSL